MDYGRRCLNCGRELPTRNRSYCSRACRNKHLTRKDMAEEPKYRKICENCGKEFLARRPTRKYCSNKCNYEVQGRKKRKRRPRPKGAIWQETREKIYSDYNGRCWLCEEPLPDRWAGHHLDEGDVDPASKRVVPLCPTCHYWIHSITVSVDKDGRLFYYGKALDLLRRKGYET